MPSPLQIHPHCPSHDPESKYPDLRPKYMDDTQPYTYTVNCSDDKPFNCNQSNGDNYVRKPRYTIPAGTSFGEEKVYQDVPFVPPVVVISPATRMFKQILNQIRVNDHKSIGSQNVLLAWKDLYKHVWHGPEITSPFTSLNPYFKSIERGFSPSEEDKMVYEGLRLESFTDTAMLVSAIRLAESGFYATGNGVETRCYSCNMTYRDWQTSDKPHDIHRSISPHCRHLNGSDTRNVPICPSRNHDQDNTGSTSEDSTEGQRGKRALPAFEDQREAAERYLIVGNQGITQAGDDTVWNPNPTQSGISLSSQDSGYNSRSELHFPNAVYSYYEDITRRLETYQLWPSGHCKKPVDLVDCGFFFAGYSDCVRCFVCGIGLRTWERDDDPWLEHVRWRSTCDYVKTVRGERFVVTTLDTIGRQQTENKPTDNILENDSCQKAIQMGFTMEAVKSAAESVTKSMGNDDLQLSVLLEKLLDFQEQTHSAAEAEQTTRDNSVTVPPENSSAESTNHVPGGASSDIPKSTTGKTKSLSDAKSLETTEEENRQLKEASICKICLDETANIVFLPCGHLVACVTCSPALMRCPLCRQHIRGTVRVHLATMSSMKQNN